MVKAMRFLEKIMHLMVLNFLWVIGTMMGLILFGFMPASYAVAKTLENKTLFEPHSPILPIIKTYFKKYKKFFLRTNVAMIVYTIILVLLIFDLYIIQFNPNLNILLVPLFSLIFYTIVSMSYFIPIFSVKEGTHLEKFKLLLTAPLINIKSTLKISLYLVGGIVLFYTVFPVFVLVFPSLYIKLSHFESKNALEKNKMILINNESI